MTETIFERFQFLNLTHILALIFKEVGYDAAGHQENPVDPPVYLFFLKRMAVKCLSLL